MTTVSNIDIEKGSVAPQPSSTPVSTTSTLAGELERKPTHATVVEISWTRRHVLLAVFCLSMFIDVLSASAFFVFTAPISADLDIIFEQQTWIITAYAVAFASFLLFWGRICDLFSAKPVFVFGFAGVALANIIISFMTDRYAFFVLRALSGVLGACVVPAAYRLIAFIFPPGQERARAYTLYGMTGSIANVTGTIIAGVFELIPNDGQMAGWRWFFRMVSMVVIPASICTYFILPHDGQVAGHAHECSSTRERIKAMDLPGITCMLAAQVLVIVGLTLGASFGWTKPTFLVPFILGMLLYPAFFFWETRLDEESALLPPSTWKIPNIPVLVIFALLTLGWWAVNFMPFIEMSHLVNGEPMVISALRTLPEGISSMIISLIMIKFPKLVSRPRTPIIIAMTFCILAYTIWTQMPGADGLLGTNYWKWTFPAMCFGSAGMQVVLIATNVGVMLAAPAGREGVLGAMLQTSMQTSNVVALSIQAGLFTTHPGGVHEWVNVRTSWYFQLGWTVVWLIGFVAWYRPQKNVKEGTVHVEVA